MDTLLTIIYGLLVLTVLVVLHEFGHFIIGKLSGIKINEFSVGFGPKIVSRPGKDGILYSVRCLPLGGFVAFEGEDDETAEDPNVFNNVSPAKRLLTIAAGPFFNIVGAILISVIVLAGFGDYTPVIHTVQENMPAYEAGLMPEDHIIKVNGEQIDFVSEFTLAFDKAKEHDSVTVTVDRNGEVLDFDVPFSEDSGNKIIGIQYTQLKKNYSLLDSVKLSFKWLWLLTKETYSSIGDLIFRGKGIENYAGPIGTISIVGQAARGGFEIILRIMSMLSLNLAIMNFLPFPALDGGRFLLVFIELITGKHLSRKAENWINAVGLVILFGFMIFLTYSDITKLISGGY